MEKGGFQLSEKIKEGACNPHDFLLQAFELWCNQQNWIMAQVATTNSVQSISRIDRLHSFAEEWELKTLRVFLFFSPEDLLQALAATFFKHGMALLAHVGNYLLKGCRLVSVPSESGPNDD